MSGSEHLLLSETFRTFRRAGCTVIASQGIVSTVLKDVDWYRTAGFGYYDPEKTYVGLSLDIFAHFRINQRGLQFLRSLGEILGEHAVEVHTGGPDRVAFRWAVLDGGLLDGSGSPDDSVTLVQQEWDDMAAISDDCMYILRLCSQETIEGSPPLDTKITSHKLAQWCLCHMRDGVYLPGN